MIGDDCHDLESPCPGWDMFETVGASSHGDGNTPGDGLEIERCDSCNLFSTDEQASAHVLWLIAGAFATRRHTDLVRLLGSGGTARQWEELGR